MKTSNKNVKVDKNKQKDDKDATHGVERNIKQKDKDVKSSERKALFQASKSDEDSNDENEGITLFILWYCMLFY